MRTRRGVAILAALALLGLVGLLVAGSVASLTLAQRSARGARADALLVASADYGLNTIMSAPRDYGLADLPFGEPVTFQITVPGTEPTRVAVAVTRLGAGILWLTADASLASGDSARRRVGLVARFRAVGALPAAPLEARGNVRLAAGIAFTADTVGEPDCAHRAPNVVTGPTASVTSPDSIDAATLSAAGDSATYYFTATQLAALDSAGVLRVRGDTTISGGAFDGVMFVDGALRITGAWTVHGLVVARGAVDASAGTLTLDGSVMSYAASGASPAIDIGAGAIAWSPCTVQRALHRALAPRPVRQRSWAELF